MERCKVKIMQLLLPFTFIDEYRFFFFNILKSDFRSASPDNQQTFCLPRVWCAVTHQQLLNILIGS